MTRVGRWSGIAAATLAVVTTATWTQGERHEADAALDGAQLFRSKGCAACHAGPDSTVEGPSFPPLTDTAAWAGERRPGMSAEEYLAESMLDPGAFVSPAFTPSGPTTAMPRLDLTEAEVDALVDHLLGR